MTNWLPVFGTLAGASIGFLASFGIAYYNHKRKADTETDSRQRERLERVYILLINIKKDYFSYSMKIISKVHNNEFLTVATHDGKIAPIVELEMLIRLYFPDFKISFKEFEIEKEKYGKLLSEAITENYSNKSLEEKQKFCSKTLTFEKIVRDAVEKIQLEIPKLIKA